MACIDSTEVEPIEKPRQTGEELVAVGRAARRDAVPITNRAVVADEGDLELRSADVDREGEWHSTEDRRHSHP